MAGTNNRITIQGNIIQSAEDDINTIIHYDKISDAWYFIYTENKYTHSENDRNEKEVALKLLFLFFEDSYKVYSLLPANGFDNTFEAHFHCKRKRMTIAESSFSKDTCCGESYPKLTKRLSNLRARYLDPKIQMLMESEQKNNASVYNKWCNEFDNISNYINQDEFNFFSAESDYGFVLNCEPSTNSNYAIIFLSLEKRVVKIDKQAFGGFSPRESEIYKLVKSVEFTVNKTSLVPNVSRVIHLTELLNSHIEFHVFCDKYEECYDYPTIDANLIEKDKIEYEEYYLISFSGTEIHSDKGKIQKTIKCKNQVFHFNLVNSKKNVNNIGMIYVGRSLVRIKRNKIAKFDYDEIKAFGRALNKESYDKDGNHNDDSTYSYQNALAQEKRFIDLYGSSDNQKNDDELFEAELYSDSDEVFAFETTEDFTSETIDYNDDGEYIMSDEIDSLNYDECERLDLREVYNQRNIELELRQNSFNHFDEEDFYELQEREYNKKFYLWIREKFGDRIYVGLDINRDDFYKSFTKRKYVFESIISHDLMTLRKIFDQYENEQEEQRNDRYSSDKTPLRKCRE